MLVVGPPVPITAAHETAGFDCGDPALNRWLVERAFNNHSAGYTRVRVLLHGPSIIGFYGLSVASVSSDTLPRRIRSGQPPDPIPAFLISRLAVDRRAQKTGLGADLLRDGVLTCTSAADTIGSRLIMVRAANAAAANFYARYSFQGTSSDPLLLVQALQPFLQVSG